MMSPLVQQIINDAIQAIVPVIVSGLLTWIVAKAITIFPALKGVLTATRIAQAEEASSNVVVAQAEDIAAGRLTVKDAAAKTFDALSESALAALKAQGTTQTQFINRVAGNSIAKMTPAVVGAPPTPITAPAGSPVIPKET